MNEDNPKDIDTGSDEGPAEQEGPSDSMGQPVVDGVTEKPIEEEAPMRKVAKRKHGIFIGIASVLVVLGGLFWVFKDRVISLLVKQPVAQVQTPGKTNEISAIDKQKASNPELVKFITPTTGETWLSSPKDMTPQGWLVVEQLSYYQDIVSGSYVKSAAEQLKENTPIYKEVGSRAGNTIIFVYSPGGGMQGRYYLFEKQSDGKITMIVRPQAAGYYEDDYKSEVISKVAAFDTTTHYDSLNIPANIEIGKGESVQRGEYLGIGNSMGFEPGNGATSTLVDTLGKSSLNKLEVKYADTHLTNVGYYILTPLGTRIGLKYEPIQTSLKGYSFDNGASLQYKDGSGEMIYDRLSAIARGCGGASAAVTRSDSLK